ncbi:MAG: glycosyltransferase [Patescibacteria group bacterium]|jgi:glycosyltransferase involved in cell wall biosynthesis
MPSFVVVIPAKDEEDFLPGLLASIKKQTVQPIEIVLADAGSTDATTRIAEAGGVRVVEGGLPGPGRNAGAQATKSDFIFFIDADIVLADPKFFEIAIADFERRQLGVATFDLELDKGSPAQHFGHQVYNAYVRFWGGKNSHAMGGCILVRRWVHEAVKGFDPTVLFCEDNDYGKRANRVMKFGVINGVKIIVTNRRLARDGELTTVFKYMLAELHILFLGPIRHNWFKYEFGYTAKAEGKA